MEIYLVGFVPVEDNKPKKLQHISYQSEEHFMKLSRHYLIQEINNHASKLFDCEDGLTEFMPAKNKQTIHQNRENIDRLTWLASDVGNSNSILELKSLIIKHYNYKIYIEKPIIITSLAQIILSRTETF